MDLSNRERDLLQALSGTTKSALSLIPGLGQAIAGWDNYQRRKFERNLSNIINELQRKIEDVDSFFSNDWLKSDEGQQFTRKVIDSAFDTQLEDKQELFINALINGVNDKRSSHLEKLKFIDMLRHLSRASLVVLAEMHKMFIGSVRGPNRSPDPISPFPLVDSSRLVEQLCPPFDPYLISSAVNEMESQGLFSNTGEWKKTSHDGKFVSGGGFATELCYTDFTARFVEFISENVVGKLE